MTARTEDRVPYVAMAWCQDEQDTAEAVLAGCLLVVADTHEAAYDELVAEIRAMGDDEERYVIVVRRAK